MKKFPSAIFASQGQNSCVMHCIPCHAHCSFALAYRKAQPLAVAHPLLQLQDGDTFEQIGNAFQVKGELANAVTSALLCPSCWFVPMLSSHASFKSSSRCYTKPLAQFDSFQRWMTLRKSRAQSLLLFNQTWCCALVNVEWRRQTKQAAMKARTCFVQRVCKCMVVIVVLPWGN